jgi:hypothetical protein
VSESQALFNGDFFMNLNSVDSAEAMERGDEALNASSLLFLRRDKCFISSSLQFLLSIKRCITVTF